MSYINYNGQLMAAGDISLPYSSHLFRYGFGLFETMLLRNGAIALADYHWERLFAGMKRLQFSEIPYTPVQLTTEILRCVERNRLERLARVRLQIFAGAGGFPEGIGRNPGFLIECHPLDPAVPEMNEQGLTTGIAAGVCKSNDTLANLKTTNALPYIMAAQQARDNNWDDALILNAQGHIIESSVANIFWIKNGKVFTPPLSEGCIAGVMRRFLLNTPGISVTEQPLTRSMLSTADELFLTNAIRGIKWVHVCGDKTFSSNKIMEVHRLVSAGS